MAAVAVGVAPDSIQPHHEVKLFNRWSFDEVQVSDISLADYIGVVPAKHATFVDGNTENDEGGSDESSIPLVVSVSKDNGGLHLEFGVTAYPDEISIDHLSIKQPYGVGEDLAYEGPEFSDLDENLQKAFLKYLEVRGIKPSTTNFLHEYMIKKDSREILGVVEKPQEVY